MPVDKHWLYKVVVYSVTRHFIYLCLLASLRAGRFKYSEGLTWYPTSLTEFAWASALKTCYRLIWHFFYTALLCGCLSRKHCWKRKSKQNPYAATQFVNLSLYAQLLTSSGHIGQTSSLSLKPAQPRFFMLKKEGLRSLVLFRGLRKCQTITILLLYSVAMWC